MKSIKKEIEHEIVIKKSRFICYMKNIHSEQEAKEYIEFIRELHPDARHHCSSYIVGNVERANDDGEPSGTAGMPMLNVLKHHELTSTIAVVVRYFGGIKLGAGGLVRAYSDSVARTLDEAEISILMPGKLVEVTGSYKDVDKIKYILNSSGITDVDTSFEANVIFKFQATDELYESMSLQILDYNHLIKIKVLENVFVLVN